MAILTGKQLGDLHAQVTAKTIKAINSDFVFEVEGYEHMWLLAKQVPWPTLSTTGEIEVPGPAGSATWQPQVAKKNLQGPITLMENKAGEVDKMLLELLTKGGIFNARVYEGVSPTNYSRYKPLKDCFIQCDPVDRDWENKGQILQFSGTLFYHYTGEVVEGTGEF